METVRKITQSEQGREEFLQLANDIHDWADRQGFTVESSTWEKYTKNLLKFVATHFNAAPKEDNDSDKQ